MSDTRHHGWLPPWCPGAEVEVNAATQADISRDAVGPNAMS